MSSTKGLPSNWTTAAISEITDSAGGGTPSKADPSYWTGGTIPWVSPKDMKSFLILGTEDVLTDKALERLALIPPNSVLAVVRSGILSRTFPVSINTVPVTINQDMRAFIPKPGIKANFLAMQLVAKEREVLDSCSKDGTTVASIEGQSLARFKIALAPEAEQQRIIDKLDEVLAELDAGVAELKAAQAKLTQYRQALLKAAVEGALTAGWRAERARRGEATESGAQLLERILAERRKRWEAKQLARFKEQGKAPPKGWQDKYPEPVKPDTTGLPELPDGWIWASLDQAAELITSGSRGWAEYYAANGAVFIRSQNINKDRLDLEDIAFVKLPPNSEGTRTQVFLDDVLLTITGANVGRTARVHIELKEAYVSQHVALIRLVERCLSSYIHMFLAAIGGGRGQLNKMAYGAGKPGLNLEQVASVVVPVPPLNEISALMERVELQLAAADQQLANITTSMSRCLAQRKNILKSAFSGQLVPQDPNDEPASALLERIRLERENARNGAVGKRRRGQRRAHG